MASLSSRWGFTLPDPADTVDIVQLNNDLITVDNALGATPCTSSTRPSTPINGQIIREHDTGLVYIWDSTSNTWAAVAGSSGGSGGILPAIVTSKGDLIVGTANAVVSRLAAGTNGQVLTVDAAQATGVRWGTISADAGSLVINAKVDYGATGGGTADDTTAIQNAINAANTAGGGRVYLPAGVYKLTSALTMKRRVVLLGDGTAASDANTGTILFQSSTSADAIAAVDQRDMTIENLSLVGPGSGSGTGIRFTRSVNGDIARLVFRGIQVTGFGAQGIELSNPITSVFDSVLVDSTPVGWNVHGVTGAGGAAGTSCVFLGCYTAGCTQTGYRLDNMCYCAFVGCASDACGIGYELIESGTQGISFTGCGCESTVSGGGSYPGYGWKINGAIGVTLSGCFTFDILNTSVWVTGSAAAVNITGFSENTPQGGVTSSIKVDSGCTATLDSISVATAMSLAAGTTPLSLPAITSTTSASSGAATALPANPVGYITVAINGTNRKVPYYA